MKELSDICFLVNARLGSTRLPGKMLKPFANSSLFEIALEKLKRSSFPDSQIYAGLHDQELKDIATKRGINIIHRTANSVRKDNTEPPTLPEVFEWWEELAKNYKYYFLINACCPLLKVSTINSFVETFIESTKGGLFSVVEHKRFFYRKDSTIINNFHGPQSAKSTFNTKFVEPIYSAAPLRAGTLTDLPKSIYMGPFDGQSDPPFFIIPQKESMDIDYESEFELAQICFLEDSNLTG